MCVSRCLALENDCINCLEDYETQTSTPSCIFDSRSSSTLRPLLQLMDDVCRAAAYVLAPKYEWVCGKSTSVHVYLPEHVWQLCYLEPARVTVGFGGRIAHS